MVGVFIQTMCFLEVFMDYSPLSPEELEQLRVLRNSQGGFSSSLGITFDTLSLGCATASMDLGDPRFTNASGTTVHGGVVFTLADVTAGCATWSSGFYGATAGADIHYIAPVLKAKRLVATAKALQFGKRMYVFNVEVRDETQRLIAQGTFSFMTLSRRILEEQ